MPPMIIAHSIPNTMSINPDRRYPIALSGYVESMPFIPAWIHIVIKKNTYPVISITNPSLTGWGVLLKNRLTVVSVI